MHFLTRLSTVLILVLCLISVPAWAQQNTQPDAQQAATSQGIWDVLSDPNNIAPAAFLLSNLADAKTDWKFTLSGKEYTITPGQRLSIAGGSIFASFVVKHYFPCSAKYINVVMGVATAYFAGRAYANTFNHGTLMPVPNAPEQSRAAGSTVAFSVQLRR